MDQKLLDLYTKLQPKFREVMEPIRIGDMAAWWDNIVYFVTTDFQAKCVAGGNGYIIFPRTIDDSSEEARKRSLWGMLKGHKMLEEDKTGRIYLSVTEQDSIYADNPTEAILRALCAQWEVEV